VGLIAENRREYRLRTGIIGVKNGAESICLSCSEQSICSTLAGGYTDIRKFGVQNTLSYIRHIHTYISIYIYIYITRFVQTFEKFIKRNQTQVAGCALDI
jgi:hypothetical protein